MVVLDKLQLSVLWGGGTSLLCADAVNNNYVCFDAITGRKVHFVVFGCMIQSGSPVD